MQAEKQAIDVKSTAEIAAMTTEQRSIRYDELTSAPEGYENSLEFVELLLGADAGLVDDQQSHTALQIKGRALPTSLVLVSCQQPLDRIAMRLGNPEGDHGTRVPSASV